jgi:hypothetical protein
MESIVPLNELGTVMLRRMTLQRMTLQQHLLERVRDG